MKKFLATFFSAFCLAACAQESVSKDAGWEEDGLAGEETSFPKTKLVLTSNCLGPNGP